MDPVWGCEWCEHGVGTCDCSAPCGADACEINSEFDVSEEEFDRMMYGTDEQNG